MVKVCEVVTINCPLHPETEHLFDERMISERKRGAYIVNTARGALESGQLAGYAGDSDEYLIVDKGKLAGTGAHFYSASTALETRPASPRKQQIFKKGV